MWTAVIVLAVLSTLASIAMTGYGALVLTFSHFDPTHTDRVETNFAVRALLDKQDFLGHVHFLVRAGKGSP